MASHLTFKEREFPYRLKKEGTSKSQIARLMGRDRSTIYRELRRKCWLSRQTIYNWIDRRAPEWRRWLRRAGRPPERRGKLTGCVRIEGRGKVINHRRRYGDWEGDTIVGKGRRCGGG